MANAVSRFINSMFRSKRSADVTSTTSGGVFTSLSEVSDYSALCLSTVYACVEKISSTIAKLPLESYIVAADGSRRLDRGSAQYEMLNYSPNPRTTRYDFFKLVVVTYLLRGNAYIYLTRDPKSGCAVRMDYWHPFDVSVEVDEKSKEIVRYTNTRLGKAAPPSEVVHIRNFSTDGIFGVSTLTHARHTLGLALSAEENAGKFFADGGATRGILSSDNGRLTDDQRRGIRGVWREMQQSGDIPVLEQGLRYQQISINPQDAQLLESRKFGVPEICRFFDISPVKVHDLSHSSYSTVEAVNIDFLNDTITPHLTKIEQELRRKVYPETVRKRRVIDFDTSSLIRGDSTAQANLYGKLSSIGAMTPNEVRGKFNLPPVDGGEYAYMQVNMQRLTNFDKPVQGAVMEEQQQGAPTEDKTNNTTDIPNE